MFRRVGLIVALCCLAAAGSAQAAQASTTVQVGPNSTNTFKSPSVTIPAGGTVNWTWEGSDHSVTSGSPPGTPDGKFDSGIKNAGDSFSETFDSPGTYHYYCKLHYAEGMVGTITVVGPVARFTTSPKSPLAGQPVTFDATASTAPAGASITSYHWMFGDGVTLTTATPTTTHTYAGGSWTASLTVVDDQPANSNPATHIVNVLDRPTARFTAKPSTTTPGKAVTFDGSTSSDSDGDAITSYQWNFGDGTTLTTASATASHVYAIAGTYKPALTVLDAHGSPSTTVTHTVTVKTPPRKPTGSFTFSPAHPVIGQPVALDASKSTDPNGFPITSYTWSFGDGSYPTPLIGASPTAVHAYSHSGTFTVRLVVTDSHGLTSVSVSHAIVVSRPPPPRLSQLHVRVCKHRSRFCAHRGIKVRFTLTAAGRVALTVRPAHHRRLVRDRVVTAGAGNNIVYLRLRNMRGLFVLVARVSGGDYEAVVFRVRKR